MNPMMRPGKASRGLEFEFNRLRHEDGRPRLFLRVKRRIEERRSVDRFVKGCDVIHADLRYCRNRNGLLGAEGSAPAGPVRPCSCPSRPPALRSAYWTIPGRGCSSTRTH